MRCAHEARHSRWPHDLVVFTRAGLTLLSVGFHRLAGTGRRCRRIEGLATVADKFTTVDDYISSFPDDVQVILQKVRRTIKKVVPAADEKISYQIPTITLDGSYLVYFAAWKHHIAVYPLPTADEAFERELAPYKTGKGTAKFPLQGPIPYDLIERLVALLVEQRPSR